MSTEKKSVNISFIIHSIVCLALLFGFGYLPSIAGLEPLGMKILGIFIGLLYGWTFIGFIWPSMLGLIALGFTGYATPEKLIAEGFSNTQITIYVLLLFIFAKCLDDVGLSKKIAYWFVSRKINVGRPWVFTTMIWLAAVVLGASVSLFASIILMWSIFYEVCVIVGYKPKEKYPVIVLVGIVFAAMLGYAILPFKAIGLMALTQMANVANGATIDFVSFTIVLTAVSAVALILYILVCKYIIRPDVSLLMGDEDYFEKYRGDKLTKEQLVCAIILVIYMFAMFAPSVGILKATLPGIFFKMLGNTGSLFFLMAIMAFIKVDGRPILDFQECAKGINWEVIIMFVSTMPVASALSSSEAGVMDMIVRVLTPIFDGMSPLLFMIIFLLFAGILTQVAHNLVLVVLLTPIAYNFAVMSGASPYIVITLLVFALSIAMATPGGSAMGALIYLNTEWIGTENAYKYCLVAVVISLVSMLIVGIPVGTLIF